MGFENLNIGSGFDKLKETLQGDTVKQFRAGSSIDTAGDILMNAYDPNDPTNSETVGTTQGGPSNIGAIASDFNPFNVFRYKRFGKGAGGSKYDFNKHNDGNLYGGGLQALNDEENKSKANLFSYVKNAIQEPNIQQYNIGDFQKTVRNPTAKLIIDSSKKGGSDSIGPAPYSYNDFIFCKHYGKIPNNRLVTLRRFMQPVQDNLKIIPRGEGEASDLIAIPISQALTFFGEGADNPLSTILPLGWDVKWSVLEAKVKDITGNEKLAGDLIAATGVTETGTQGAATAGIALTNGEDSATTALQISGYEAEMQEYVQTAYDQEKGPYWNRVLGPVNVIHKSRKRERGMGETMFTGLMTVKFAYNLRSYKFKNPKVAMLDLISNFLTLTYNTAPFWGGGYRYFQNPGVRVSLAGQDAINEGRFVDGVAETLEAFVEGAQESVSGVISDLSLDFNKILGKEAQTDSDGNAAERQDYVAETDAANKLTDNAKKLGNILLAEKAANLLQKPLSYRSLLEGRPIGEWHMTIGNPLDPIAAVGDLICEKCTMTLGKKLGADDFPTEVEFTVVLKHGRPRAKQDIESIFNLGGGGLSYSKIEPPSSARGTFEGDAKVGQATADKAGGLANVGSNLEGSTVASIGQPINTKLDEVAVAENFAGGTEGMYKQRVTGHYGTRFGDSSLLNSYIKTTQV